MAVPVLGSTTALAVQKAWAGREEWVRGSGVDSGCARGGCAKHGTDVIDSVRGNFGAVAFVRLAWVRY